MLKTIGWLGSILLALCGLPQLVKTIETGKCDDVSFLFLSMWLSGELLSFVYLLIQDIKTKQRHTPIYFNYALNIAIVACLIALK